MMKRLSQIALLLALVAICLLTFQSCEFDSNDNNYVELEKPIDITIAIDLAGVKPNEVIQVPNNSHFYYTLNAEGKEILQLKYSLDGKEIMTNTHTTVFLAVELVDNEVHDLKVEMGFKTGSGSLADWQNIEAYLGEHTFKIKFIDISATDLNITHTVDANNNLKLEWKAPQNIDIEKYEVYNNVWDHKVATITDLSDLSVVDPDYVYGFTQYEVRAIPKNSTQHYIADIINVQAQTLTSDNATAVAVENNKIRLTWTNPNPYPANYVVIRDSDIETMQIVTDNSNTVDMPRKPFNSSQNEYVIYILPKFEDPKNFITYREFYHNFRESRITASYFCEYYDTKNNMLYALDFKELHMLDATKDLTLINTVQLDKSTGSTGAKVRVSDKGIVGINDYFYTLSLYADNTLDVRTAIIANAKDFNFGGDLLLTDTDEIIDEFSNFIYKVNVYNTATTTQPLFTIAAPKPNVHHASVISPDGKYILFMSQELSIKLYEIVNNQPIERKLWENANIKGSQFNPANSSEMVLIHRNKFEIIDLATQQVKFTQDGQFVCVDPATGNVMFHKGDINNIAILDNSYNKVLANITLDIESHYGTPRLYNNNILWQNIYTDYRKLIEK